MKNWSPDFKCKKCGACCREFSQERGVIIWPQDSQRIADQMNMSVQHFLNTYCYAKELQLQKGKVIIHLLKDTEGHCILLNDGKTCSIHGFKPDQCANTPFDYFWDENIAPNYECIGISVIPAINTSGKDKALMETLKIVKE